MKTADVMTAIDFMRAHPNPSANDLVKAVALFGGKAVRDASALLAKETK